MEHENEMNINIKMYVNKHDYINEQKHEHDMIRKYTIICNR